MEASVQLRTAALLCFAAAFVAASAMLGLAAPSAHMERDTNGVTLPVAGGALRIKVCSAGVIHVVASPTPVIPDEVVPVAVGPCGETDFTVSSNAHSVKLKTTDLLVEVTRVTGAVRFFDASGKPLLSEQAEGGRTMAPQEIGGDHLYQVRQNFLLSPGEALYGLGQHQEGFLDLRDIPIRMLQANTNIAIPFLVSTNGYGLLWNDAALTDFNPASQSIALDKDGHGEFRSGPEGDYGFLLSGNYRQKLMLTVGDKQVIDLRNIWLPLTASGKIHLAGNTTYKIVAATGGDTELSVHEPSSTMAFRSEASRAVDYYFFYGPAPQKIIAEYRELTGPAPLLPKWAYGFWQCRERYASQQQILDTAAEFRQRKIPVDVFVQDWQYWGKYGWNAMRFDEGAYPDPTQMMDELHKKDLHLVISVWAKFGAETAVDKQMVASHLVLTNAAETGEPGEAQEREDWADLFNPAAQKQYWADIDSNLFRDGIDGWWLDASEPEGDPLKDDTTFLGPGREIRNAFPLYETSAVFAGQKEADPNKRVVILSRSAFLGQQRNGSISWSGDIPGNWETFRRQIPAGLGFSISGLPYWTTDIGGFFRPIDQYNSKAYHELLVRWFEFGAFSPIFRIHGYHSNTEMWNYGPEVERILTKYDDLRYRLMPYIYSDAWSVTSRGASMMQALPSIYPADPAIREVGDEFLFGDSLLISPVTQPNATSRSVVLPAGDDWLDFWTGECYAGGISITSKAPLDRLPILVKAGSIVPLGPVVQSTAQLQDQIEIRVYPGKDVDFLLYEDAGDGYAYADGARATIPMHWDDRNQTLTIGEREGSFAGIQARHEFQIVVVRAGRGAGEQNSDPDRSVSYDGQTLTLTFRKHRIPPAARTLRKSMSQATVLAPAPSL